jgi:hypothetical protein
MTNSDYMVESGFPTDCRRHLLSEISARRRLFFMRMILLLITECIVVIAVLNTATLMGYTGFFLR